MTTLLLLINRRVTPPAAPTVAQPAVPNPAPDTAEGQSKPTAS